jgi:transposase
MRRTEAFMLQNPPTSLFPVAESDAADDDGALVTPLVTPAPRFNMPERFQGEFRAESLDQRLDADHDARLVWKLVEGLDLSVLYHEIKAVEGQPGRNPSDPRVLFALWLYASLDGVGSARKLEKLCHEHRAYEWLRGGVPVNYHLLADFRVEQQELLDQLMTDSLAGLLREGLVDLETTAQDGMRIRAHAGANSFRRQPTLQEAQEEARRHVNKLRQDLQDQDGKMTKRQAKAKERAARERLERISKALQNVKEIAKQREIRTKGDGDKARASTTDPEARTMKMPDSGFRPAYNIQFATDAGSGLIVGVDVTNQGTDSGQMEPMIKQIQERLDETPTHHLTDGGFSSLADIERTAEVGPMVITPIKEEKKMKEQGLDPYAAKKSDSPALAAWRARMGTDLGKTLYKLRAQTAELTNARMRNRGLYQVLVRGLAKVKACLLWYVLAHNLLRGELLRAQKAKSMGLPNQKSA